MMSDTSYNGSGSPSESEVSATLSDKTDTIVGDVVSLTTVAVGTVTVSPAAARNQFPAESCLCNCRISCITSAAGVTCASCISGAACITGTARVSGETARCTAATATASCGNQCNCHHESYQGKKETFLT